MKDLNNRVALVTGGSRGIGAAVAVALAKAGADVAVNYRDRADAAHAVRAEIAGMGRKAIAVRADVSVATDVKRMVAEVEAHLGGIDILVNNAAIAHPRKLKGIRETEWDEVLTVNLKSVFLVTQAVVGGMRQRKWGRIINLSSIAAQTGGAVGAHYAASKAGIIGLTHSCASSFVKDGITVNAIAPALIETDRREGNWAGSASRFDAALDYCDVAGRLWSRSFRSESCCECYDRKRSFAVKSLNGLLTDCVGL
jgi:3-oxoacyl-[acyl-carrier protein] reductase